MLPICPLQMMEMNSNSDDEFVLIIHHDVANLLYQDEIASYLPLSLHDTIR